MNGAIITLIIDDIIVGDAVDLSPCRSSVAPMLNKIKGSAVFPKRSIGRITRLGIVIPI